MAISTKIIVKINSARATEQYILPHQHGMYSYSSFVGLSVQYNFRILSNLCLVFLSVHSSHKKDEPDYITQYSLVHSIYIHFFYTHTNTHIHIYIYICVCVCVCVCVCIYK